MLQELFALNQWVLWKYELVHGKDKPTKVPYQTTGYKASPADPRHWTSYQIAYNVYMNGGYDGLGFAISTSDNITFIDLDDTTDMPEAERAIITHYQMQIVEAFDSYSEVSPSGKGLHIIIHGKVSQNRVRPGVEIYTAGHYMTMTFNAFQNKPIKDNQPLLTQLWEQLTPKKENLVLEVRESEQLYSDLDIYEQCARGKNGELFLQLWQGKWEETGRYEVQKQSAADFALVNIIGFYSRNVEQIKRMFLSSGLGYRLVTGQKKKKRNYVEDMARRSFDLQLPDVNIENIKATFEAEKKTQPPLAKVIERQIAVEVRNELSAKRAWNLPEGLMGRTAKYLFDGAPHPFQEIALGGAMSLLAGVVGRTYNISGTGLNQYIVVLAGTGTGKEAAASGINKLMARVCLPENVPAAIEFLGPANISSGPALVKQLDETPCFFSVMSEIGLTLQNICAKHASQADRTFKKALLEVYTQSGENQAHRPTVYSDRNKNTKVIKSPNFSILGESVPEEFYKTVEESSVSGGFLPRFTIMEYTGQRVHYNEQHEHVRPDDEAYMYNGRTLVQQWTDLCAHCLHMMRLGKVIKVQMEPDAYKMVCNFRTHCTNAINAAPMKVEKELWTRAYLSMLKLAALVSVGGDNMNFPVVTAAMVGWSKSIVVGSIDRIMVRFEEGLIGTEESEVNQRNKVVDMIADYIKRNVDATMLKYGVSEKMHSDLVIPMGYFQKRLLSNGAFKQDRIGATNALARAIMNLINEGAISEKRPGEIARDYGKSCKAYQIVNLDRFKK